MEKNVGELRSTKLAAVITRLDAAEPDVPVMTCSSVWLTVLPTPTANTPAPVLCNMAAAAERAEEESVD